MQYRSAEGGGKRRRSKRINSENISVVRELYLKYLAPRINEAEQDSSSTKFGPKPSRRKRKRKRKERERRRQASGVPRLGHKASKEE